MGVADGAIASTKVRDKIADLNIQRGAIEEKLSQTIERLRYGAEKLLAYVDLLEQPGKLYEHAPDTVRRELLMALFAKLFVETVDHQVDVTGSRHAVNTAVREAFDSDVTDGETKETLRAEVPVSFPRKPTATFRPKV